MAIVSRYRRPSPPALNAIEAYLAREGLLHVIPHERRGPYQPAPGWSWAAVLIVAGLITGALGRAAPTQLLAAAAAILVAFLLARWLFRLVMRFVSAGRRAVGLVFLLLTALATALIVASLAGHLAWALLCLLLTYSGYQLLLHLVSLADLAQVLRHTFVRVLRVMGLLLPLMAVFVLLSVFSGELWQAIGTLQTWRLVVAIVLVVSLGGFIAQSRLRFLEEQIQGPPRLDVDAMLKQTLPLLLRPHTRSGAELQQAADEVRWRHLDEAHAEARDRARSALHRHVLARLGLSAVVLAVIVGGYLYALFALIFPGPVVEKFLDGLFDPRVGVELSLLRVTLFLVAFIVAYFLIQALTDKSMQEALFADLADDLARWEHAIVLYRSLLHPGYQLLQGPAIHTTLDLAELAIVVPPGAGDDAVRDACARSARALGASPSAVLVVAHERNPSPVYDWGLPGRRWIYLSLAEGQELVRCDSGQDGLWCQQERWASQVASGATIPDEWFGVSAYDKVLGAELWNARLTPALYRPYVRTGPGLTLVCVFLYLARPLADQADYRALAERTVAELERQETLIRPQLIYVLIGAGEAQQWQTALLWRSRPRGLVSALGQPERPAPHAPAQPAPGPLA